MYNWADYVAPSNMQRSRRLRRELHVRHSRRTRSCSRSSRAAAVGQYDIWRPTAEFDAGDGRGGLPREDRLVEDPEREVHQPEVHGPLVGPERRVPPAQGLGHDRASRCARTSSPRTSKTLEATSSTSRRSTRARSSSSTRPVTSSSAPLKALGYSLNSVDPRRARGGPQDADGASRRTCSRSTPTRTRSRCKTEEAVLGLTLDRRHRRAAGDDEVRGHHQVRHPGRRHAVLDGHVDDPQGRPHPRRAHDWLNFIHDPEIQAQETETNYYATAERGSQEVHRPGDPQRPDRLRAAGRSSTRPSSSPPRRYRSTRTASGSGRSSSRSIGG